MNPDPAANMTRAVHPVILFDGVCHLCSRSVQFILKHDKPGKFRFASLQSPVAQQMLVQRGLPANGDFNSFLLIKGCKVYTRSSAALRVLKQLGSGWTIFYVFLFIPPFIRNGIYDWISRNRYRWFGRRDACWIPRPEWTARFLDQEDAVLDRGPIR
jgi:predicted DCC family thiol-disulfide oxidoreductase YuxK